MLYYFKMEKIEKEQIKISFDILIKEKSKSKNKLNKGEWDTAMAEKRLTSS